MIDFCSLNYQQVQRLFADLGQPKFRVDQFLAWVYAKGCLDMDAYTNVSKELRSLLRETIHFPRYTIESVQHSRVDNTRKILLRFPDGHAVETVLIPVHSKLSQCLSTQVGCKMGCTFCATASMGFKRNLSVSEILAQAFAAREIIEPHERVGNFVFMGMGEPLDNYENSIAAIKTIIHPQMMGYSHRHVTLSTCGILKGIRRLSREELPCNLAISLHAVNDEQRSFLMPVNRAEGIDTLMQTLREFPLSSKKVITIEYLLIRDFNDSTDDAKKLLQLLRGLRCKVNLIVYNPHDYADYHAPDEKRVLQFQRILAEKGVMTFIRKSGGSDIDAACGQLAGKSS